MTEDDVKNLIAKLEDLKARTDVIRLHFNDLRNQVITDEIREKLADIDVEEQTTLESLDAGIAQLTEEIRQAVVSLGKTVATERVQVVYNKGRESWDTKALNGYAAANPSILVFKKHGDPFVVIRGL